jgi:MFS family permease
MPGRPPPTTAGQATGTAFRLRDIAVVAYGPTLVSSIGYGAVTPVLALRARELGADVGTAALVVALSGVGMLLASLPSGVVVARIGERRTLMYAAVVDAVAMAVSALAGSVWLLAVATAVSGTAWTAFLIARQGFMIEMVPFAMRARAMSTLGGTFRIGLFVGPLVGAGGIHLFGLASAFWLAGVLSLAAGLLARLMPDVGADGREAGRAAGFASIWSVLWEHRRTLATLGVGVIVISASRAVRATLLPLWADHIGISASTTSLLFSLVALIDIVMFYPGGSLMDRRGRAVVAVPVVLGVAVASLALPMVHGAVGLAVAMGVIALANGLGSGIVMTIGADTAPVIGRAQYLGGWRLCGDLGGTSGPLLISAVAAVGSLAAAAVVVGVICLLGAAWVGWWTHRLDVDLAAGRAPRQVSRSSP